MKYAIIFLAVLLISIVPVQADLPEPGMTPDHPFYFMDRFFDLFRSPAAVADKRAAEVLAMGQVDNQRGLERAQEGYERAMEKRQRAAQNNPQVAEEVARQSSAHAAVLAKDARLDEAVAVGTRNREEALRRLEEMNPERAALVAQNTLEELLGQLSDDQFAQIRQAVRTEEQARRFDEQVEQYLTYEQVEERVARLYPGDTIVEGEREMRRGILIYSLELRSGIELYMNGRTGELLSAEQDDDDFYSQDDDERFESRLSVAEAEALAREVVGDSRLLEFSSDVDNGRSVYEFEFVGDIEVTIDALTGEVIKVEPFQADISVEDVRLIVDERYPEASILEIELEDEGYYEVELDNDVELLVDATTGDILRVDDDRDDDRREENADEQFQARISFAEAEAIAREFFGDARLLERDTDVENGRSIYELEFAGDGEIRIDAMTGDVLEMEQPVPAAISRAEAVAIALERFPDEVLLEAELDDDGYFEIELTNDIELKIDARSGDILEIDD